MTIEVRKLDASAVITDSMQYFRLPPRKQRIASQLDQWADEAISVFFKDKEEEEWHSRY